MFKNIFSQAERERHEREKTLLSATLQIVF